MSTPQTARRDCSRQEGLRSMTSIPEIAAKVKTSRPPSTRTCKRRKHEVARAMPYYAVHTQAPTLSDIQQATMGVFARLMMMRLLQDMEGNDGR